MDGMDSMDDMDGMDSTLVHLSTLSGSAVLISLARQAECQGGKNMYRKF